MIYAAVILATLVLWFAALVDLVFTEDRMSDKAHMGWVLVALFLPVVGATLWLTVGRRRYKSLVNTEELRALVYAGGSGGGRGPVRGPDDDSDFLRRIGEQIEAQRRNRRFNDETAD
jgi:hypothetical protein